MVKDNDDGKQAYDLLDSVQDFLFKVRVRRYRPMMNVTLDEKCSFCTKQLIPDTPVRQLPDCHHIFHAKCLEKLLVKNLKYPACSTCNLKIEI